MMIIMMWLMNVCNAASISICLWINVALAGVVYDGDVLSTAYMRSNMLVTSQRVATSSRQLSS